MSMDTTAHQKIAADFAAGRIGQRLVHAQLVEASAALKVKIVQQVDDDVSGRRHEIHIPRSAVAIHRHGTAAV